MLKDKSFDLSAASSAPAPLSAPSSGPPHASDSDSFSSEGLGMPQLEDECLEDLCDQLQGCLETSENSLEFRNTELRRIAGNLRVRSLSESYSDVISDLDSADMRPPRTRVTTTPPLLSLSCPDLAHTTITRAPPSSPLTLVHDTLVTHSLSWSPHDDNDNDLTQLMWPILVWTAASAMPNYQRVIFKNSNGKASDKLRLIVDNIQDKNLSVAHLFSLLKQFTSCANDDEDFYTFLQNKLSLK